MKRFDKNKAVRYIESGWLIRLKHYLREFEKKQINFTLNFKTGKEGQTPLHIACSYGDDAIVRLLIKHGAKIDIRDKKGNTPMHTAAKYVSDKNLYGSYKLLIDPLIKEFPEGLHAKNQEDRSPSDYLNDARERYHKVCQEAAKEKKDSSSESDSEEGGEKKEEEEEMDIAGLWEEKLADEMRDDCADFEEKFPSGSWSQTKLPSFEQWADEIAAEYKRKHRYYDPMKYHKTTKRQKFMERQEEQERMIKEYKEGVEKRRENKLVKNHQKYQEGLEKMKATNSASATKKLKFKDIPWPCRGTLDEMIEVVMKGLEPGSDAKARKKYIMRQLMLWHPDKFRARCYDILDDEDKDVILDQVKLLSQSLTKMLKDGPTQNYTLE